jgi:hydrogenase-1 operon protein HyaF
MKPIAIPIRTVGPGSQPAEDADLDYMQMPRGMSTFSMPQIPENAEAAAMAEARDVIDAFVAAFGRARRAGDPHHRVDLGAVGPAALEVLNQSLGEGEVAIRIAGPTEIRIQETVFAGIWREREFDADGRLLYDALAACPVPPVAVEAARAAAASELPLINLPAGAMNAPALLHEIRSQVRTSRPGASAHVINLTLLPLSPDDQVCLDAALPVGPVAVLSRGFGNCRITSTGVHHVWRVQYFNNAQTLILNTIEIVDIPEVALAAAEDLADSEERLVELLQWMRES